MHKRSPRQPSFRQPSFRPLAVAAALGAGLTGVAAQAQTIPNAGQLLQEAPPPPSTLPSVGAKPNLVLPSGSAALSATDTTPIAVKRIEITGATRFQAAALHALVADAEGRTLTLADLNGVAGRITAFYRAHGYGLDRAYLPAQSLDDGVLRIAVLEARYGKVRVHNHSHVLTPLAAATLDTGDGQAVDTNRLEHRMLLLGDLPGVDAHARLSPGANTGESDLDVDVNGTPRVLGNVSVDNLGSPYTGRARGAAGIQVNNLVGLGDTLSLNGLTSGRGLSWGQVAYQATVTGFGTRLGAAYSYLDYKVGGALAAAGAHGTASMASAWVNQPIVRTENVSLAAHLQYDHRALEDITKTAGLDDKRSVDSVTASLSLASQDHGLGGGVNHASVSLTPVSVHFHDAFAELADAATARTRDGAFIVNFEADRLQRVARHTRLYGQVSWQVSDKNLDSSEQWLLGGAQSVRGYQVASLSGSSGVLATGEVRQDLPLPVPGAVEAVAFVDYGALKLEAYPWTTAANSYHLASVGAGVNWNAPGQWQFKAQIATPVGDRPTILGKTADVQAWLQASKAF